MVGTRHGRDVEVDEVSFGIARLGVRRGRQIARFPECLIDLADGQVQTTNRAVAKEGLPVADLALGEIDAS